MFLKVVFSQFKILFKFSRFNFCSCDSVFSALFACAVFQFSEVVGSFRLSYFCLLIFDVSGIVRYLVDYLFSGVFLLFQGQKTNLSLLLF